ncbi:MAG: hypothetical protein IH614_13675 [Desulfuromonadales bacterium]|nr:hypothetical protein [Desulfuromonadales bacterium]
MLPLDRGQGLSRVTRFELIKEAERFIIEVHFMLFGGGRAKYEAFLYDDQGECSSHELSGSGSSEVEALRDLLLKIRLYSAEELDRFFLPLPPA